MDKQINWIIKPGVIVPEPMQSAIGGYPLVAESLYRHGIRDTEEALAFLDPNLYHPASADELPDIQEAYALLSQAVQKGKTILVWGDFDVDGQTSTTLLVEGLRSLNGNVTYHVPIRAKESHGISRAVLENYLSQGFDLLLTCDTGVSEMDNIQLVRDQGIPVIITDHHALPEKLPPANAVVNPQRLPKGHPLRTLPGVGVAYKLIEGFFAYLGKDFDPGPFIELAALGIVADIAGLQSDTRYLLQRGLSQLRHTDRLGLQTLFTNAAVNPENLNEGHISYQIAPRLNAIGRMADANLMVEFLLTNDVGRARVMGMQIEALNAKRRFESRQVEKAAEQMLQNSPEDRMAPAIVLYHPEWPGGIVGIVASRLVERYQKPAILLTGKDPIHGSARSVEGIDIHRVIGQLSDLLSNFGGHPKAAGLSLPPANFELFKYQFLKNVERAAQLGKVVPALEIDQVITIDQISFDLVDQIERLAPFGEGFPPLKFLIRDLKVISHAAVGQNGEHRQVTVEDQEGFQQRIIWWKGGDAILPDAQFDLVCSLTRSDYRGKPQINAEWLDYRLSEEGQQEVEEKQLDLKDLRDAPHPNPILLRYLEEIPDVLVWSEGQNIPGVRTCTRSELRKTSSLIIWTAPPSQEVLMEAIQRSKAKQLMVFGLDPKIDDPQFFLNRLAGLIKYAFHHKEGRVSITQLASACAAQKETIITGLSYWEARGNLKTVLDEDIAYLQRVQTQPNPSAVETYQSILNLLLEESRSYRRFFRKFDLNTLRNQA